MAILYSRIGVAVDGTTSLVVPYFDHIVVGEQLAIFITHKNSAATVNVPAGWTQEATITGGAGSGVDRGTVRGTILRRTADGTETGTVTITFAGLSGTTCMGGVMVSFQGSVGGTWVFPGSVAAADSGSGTAFSAVASNPGLVAGDVVIPFAALNTDNASFSGESLVCAGTVFDVVNERFDLGTPKGEDCGLLICDAAVISGPSAGTITFNATATAGDAFSPKGGVIFFVLREIVPTAVITKSAHNHVIAGITRVTLSAQESFQTTASPPDCAMTAAMPHWDFGDGTTDDGFCVSKRWETSGLKTVTCTVPFSNGASSTTYATVNVEAAPSFLAFTKYVDNTRPDDTGDGNSPATAYKTVGKAITVWAAFRGASSTGFAFGRILLRAGQSFPFAGSGGIDFGPLLIEEYLVSGPATTVISLDAGAQFDLGSTVHENLYDNPVVARGIDFVWAAENSNNLLTMGHVATQLEDAVVTKAGIYFVGAGSSQLRVTQTKGWRYGTFPSGSYLSIQDSSYTGSGHDASLDHQVYASNGVDHSSFRGITTDGTGASAAYAGIKKSGTEKLWIDRAIVRNSTVGFDLGGNLVPAGEQTDDVIITRAQISDVGVAFYANYLNRVSIRNTTLLRCSQAMLRVQSYDATKNVDGLQILNATLTQCSHGVSMEADGGFARNVTIENVIVTMPALGTGVVDHIFFQLAAASDAANLTIRNCQYQRGTDTHASTTFAIVSGYNSGNPISFDDWVANISHETGSRYGDPLFVNASSDLSLQKFSPCVDTGIATGITIDDILGNTRPQGGAYDIGAYEYLPIAGLPAFPGAEGYGSDTIGGRGGVTIFVTNLNESGIGSLRWAVEYNGPRTVVFRVSGTITHTSASGALKITNPFITIAGQTAPGEGITLKGEELRIQTHDVIIRYLRVRTGDKDTPHDGYDNRDCINFGQPSDVTGVCQTYNVILDHCSLSFSVDESLTCWFGAHHITYQRCLISEPLAHSLHPKSIANGTPHSMSMLVGSSTSGSPSYCLSIHHNVIISGNQRNPQFSYCDRVDFRNNLVYNWGSKTGSNLTAGAPMEIESPGLKRLNIVANYYVEGPNSRTPAHPTWIRVGNDVATLVDPGAEIFISKNFGPADGVMVTDKTFNNWLFLRSDGNVQIPETYGAHQYRMSAPFDCPAVTTMEPELVPSILADVGANRPYRDEDDARVILTFLTDTGLIIDSTDQVGGWLTMTPGTPYPDADQDGMPDYWEVAHGLNPNDAADALIVTTSGYTNLELFLNSNELPPGTSVNLTVGAASCGAAASPVILPCAPGSGQISPFMKGLVYGHSTHDAPAQNFERWEDLAANFACWGNGEPKSYTDEEGVTVGAHQGRVSSTKTGPTTAEPGNFLVLNWFSRFIPRAIAFNNLLNDDAHESKPLTTGTGEERRYYYTPAMRRALFHSDPAERQVGWDAIQSINRETIERRPFFHNSKNGNQGGPAPFTAKKGGPPEEINHNELDEFGNARSWNAVGNRAPFGGDQWNAWDKQHNAGPTFHLPACIGSRAAMVNLWNNWRWVITSFFPGSDGDTRGKQFDVPRSVGFGAFLAVYGFMAGFEWADPLMVKAHCGGNSNGDGTGQNGDAGWKPSHYFEWLVKSALGRAVADNGRVQLMPKGFIYWNLGCDNLGEPSCLCDCTNAPVPGPGKSGCSGAAWIGPDGVNYGSQTIGLDLWHAGIECSGLMLVDSLNDYLVSIWGQAGAVLTATTAAALKALLQYAASEAIFRCVNPSTYATAHYYTATGHAQSDPPTEPRGYEKDVAQAMLDDMFSCHPEKAVDCEIRAINDGSGKWIVAEKVRDKVDLFYSLSLPFLTYVLGPNNALVKKWLSSGAFIPPPGQEGSSQATNYENHARFTDFAHALNEVGTPVVISGLVAAAGASSSAILSYPVILTPGVAKAGAALDGNFTRGIRLNLGFASAGASTSADQGHGVVISAGTGVAAAAVETDGELQQPVLIAAGVAKAGATTILTPSGSSGPQTVDAGRARAGVATSFTGLRLGGAVVIVSAVASAGCATDKSTYVSWTVSTAQCGAETSAIGIGNQSFTLFNPVAQAGVGAKGGRPVIKYKNSYTASGVAIVVEG